MVNSRECQSRKQTVCCNEQLLAQIKNEEE